MDKYRKKPVVIEATQIKESNFTKDHPNDDHVIGVIYDPNRRVVEINTLEGVMIGNIGDYIIRGVQGELYPCKPDIFKLTYDQV